MPTIQNGVAEAVAAEVRAQLARHRRSGRSIARELGYSQQSMSLRITGKIPFNVIELVAIAQLLDIPISSLLPDDLSTSFTCNFGLAA